MKRVMHDGQPLEKNLKARIIKDLKWRCGSLDPNTEINNIIAAKDESKLNRWEGPMENLQLVDGTKFSLIQDRPLAVPLGDSRSMFDGLIVHKLFPDGSPFNLWLDSKGTSEGTTQLRIEDIAKCATKAQLMEASFPEIKTLIVIPTNRDWPPTLTFDTDVGKTSFCMPSFQSQKAKNPTSERLLDLLLQASLSQRNTFILCVLLTSSTNSPFGSFGFIHAILIGIL
eukprot:TRINITY_DN9555_c0_g1_i1.p1 TRINITY_DN9555_c0_g1~~TRINITY_DN9555_c0_g1_i1.p1  ORF type:complete len:227 (-),score=40.20 TRINITY_DN9555_c0_g1_i1:52-732(-)